MPVQWVMQNNLNHLRELHLLDKEYFRVLLSAVVCSSTHLSHKMRRTGAPSPAQPETSTGKSRREWVNAFRLLRRLQTNSSALVALCNSPLSTLLQADSTAQSLS